MIEPNGKITIGYWKNNRQFKLKVNKQDVQGAAIDISEFILDETVDLIDLLLKKFNVYITPDEKIEYFMGWMSGIFDKRISDCRIKLPGVMKAMMYNDLD